MRALRFLNVAILSTLVAISAALYAQDEKQQEPKPPRHEQPRDEPRQQQEPRPEPRADEMKAPGQDQARPPKQENRNERQEQKQAHEPMEPRQSGDRHETHARPAGKGGHIPDDRFRSQFGRSHTFGAQRPVIIEGQPRFQYGGYSFILIDTWPVDWAYTDDCYIDYVDGDYFLFDLLHPGERIALMVVM